jgi:hypothetical protein
MTQRMELGRMIAKTMRILGQFDLAFLPDSIKNVIRQQSLTSIGFLDNARKEQIASFDGTKLPQNAVILPLLPFIHAFLTIF